MNHPLPAAARLAWWGTAWLRGHVVTDLLVDAVVAGDATHTVAGLATGSEGSGETRTLVAALGELRAVGATAFGVALPVEGDPVGLGGPPRFNTAALEAGEAVIVAGAGVGLVPTRVGAVITWTAHPAGPRQVPDVGEADRGLRAGLVAAANALADLDVARWRPEVADRLLDLRHREPVAAPDGVPARCLDLAGRGLQALQIVQLALEDDGGALTAVQVSERREALRPLDRAARRAVVAACSPEAWP